MLTRYNTALIGFRSQRGVEIFYEEDFYIGVFWVAAPIPPQLMASTLLPQPRAFLTSLFTPLPNDQTVPTTDPPTSPTNPPPNPLLTASPATKSNFLILHCLFPTELLPALDLLDRRLVTHLIYHPGSSTVLDNPTVSTTIDNQTNLPNLPANPATIATAPSTNSLSGLNQVYYVRSSHPRSTSRSRYYSITTSAAATSYEVRLGAWNCTCAAFTFSAFSSTPSLRDGARTFPGARGEGDGVEEGGGEAGSAGRPGQDGEWRFGGLTREREGVAMPVCKHLLACVLVERCKGLGASVEETVVGRGEVAGWGG